MRGRFVAWTAFDAPPPMSRPASLVGTGLFVWIVLITTVAGFSIADVQMSRTRELITVYAVAAVVIGLRPWRWWPRYVGVAVAGLVALVSVGYVSWVVQSGSAIAINYWSQWLLQVAAFLLALSCLPCLWPAWKRVLLLYACGIAVYQVMAFAFKWVDAGSDSFYGQRSLSATLAMVMLVGMVVAATDESLGRRARNALTAALGVSVVLAQHRSVWVAFVVATVLLTGRYVVARRGHEVILGTALSFGFFLLAAVAPLVSPVSLLPSGGGGPAPGGLPQSFQDTNTIGWRWEMWTSRMSADRGFVEWVVGGVFGETPAWGPNSHVLVAAISSHSMYVDLISMLGLAGLLIFLLLNAVALLRRGQRLSTPAIAVWSLLAYGFFYQWPPLAWALLAAAMLTTQGVASQTPSPATLGNPAVESSSAVQ